MQRNFTLKSKTTGVNEVYLGFKQVATLYFINNIVRIVTEKDNEEVEVYSKSLGPLSITEDIFIQEVNKGLFELDVYLDKEEYMAGTSEMQRKYQEFQRQQDKYGEILLKILCRLNTESDFYNYFGNIIEGYSKMAYGIRECIIKDKPSEEELKEMSAKLVAELTSFCRMLIIRYELEEDMLDKAETEFFKKMEVEAGEL